MTPGAPAHYGHLQARVSDDGSHVHVFGPSEALARELVVERVVADRITLRSGSSVWVVRLEQLGQGHLRLSGPRGVIELRR